MGGSKSQETEAEFDLFFDDCLPAVMSLARRLTGNAADAEDVAVEALGRAYAHWPKLCQSQWRRAWVLRVATNLVIGDARRYRHAPNEPVVAEDESDALVVREALVAALKKLPRRQREAVALRYLSDLSEQETAVAMGVSPGSVKTHLSRGLSALRAALGSDVGGELFSAL
jgi:RNA polymerase sigma-70 factor (sigma-E family)